MRQGSYWLHVGRVVSIALAAAVAGCGGAMDPAPQTTLVFRMRGADAQEFRHVTRSGVLIAEARAEVARPLAQRRLFPSGAIRAGDGGVNSPWHWHFVELDLVENAIELCDGNPKLVEADLPYWLNRVGRFCPWSAYLERVES